MCYLTLPHKDSHVSTFLISLTKKSMSVSLFLLVTVLGQSWASVPLFSWNTLPVFFHSSNASGPYSYEALQTIAKFSMVTIEKWQSYNTSIDDEDAMVLTMQAVKKINPEAATYFYMNAWKDRPEMTRMARELKQNPSYALTDSNGKPVVSGADSYQVFDLSQVIVQQWWQNICLNATKASGGDGCFCDMSTPHQFKGVDAGKMAQWNKGLLNLTLNVQDALGVDRFLIGKTPDQPCVLSIQIEFFSPDNSSINKLMEGVSKSKVVQAHRSLRDPGNCSTDDLIHYIAAFLIGAGEYSFFGCGQWNSQGNVRDSLLWRPEYDQALGYPLENAAYQDGVWSRKFNYGTKVTFDTSNNKGTIKWGSKRSF